MKKTSIGISIIAALLFGASAQADMITVGGDQTAGTGTLTINQDINFTVTADLDGQILFIFDEIVTSDGGQNFTDMLGLEFSVNLGARTALTLWRDNAEFSMGEMTPNDGFIQGASATVAIGDIITLHAGTGTMSTSQAKPTSTRGPVATTTSL